MTRCCLICVLFLLVLTIDAFSQGSVRAQQSVTFSVKRVHNASDLLRPSDRVNPPASVVEKITVTLNEVSLLEQKGIAAKEIRKGMAVDLYLVRDLLFTDQQTPSRSCLITVTD